MALTLRCAWRAPQCTLVSTCQVPPTAPRFCWVSPPSLLFAIQLFSFCSKPNSRLFSLSNSLQIVRRNPDIGLAYIEGQFIQVFYSHSARGPIMKISACFHPILGISGRWSTSSCLVCLPHSQHCASNHHGEQWSAIGLLNIQRSFSNMAAWHLRMVDQSHSIWCWEA